MQTFFLSPTAYGDGLTSASLGVVRSLQRIGLRVGFFKPITQPHKTDKSCIDKSNYFAEKATGIKPPNSIEL